MGTVIHEVGRSEQASSENSTCCCGGRHRSTEIERGGGQNPVEIVARDIGNADQAWRFENNSGYRSVAMAAGVTAVCPLPVLAVHASEVSIVHEESTATEATSPAEKCQLHSKDLTSTESAKDDDGAGRIWKEGDDRGAGSFSPTHIREEPTHSSNASYLI